MRGRNVAAPFFDIPINPDFAKRMHLAERLEADHEDPKETLRTGREYHASSITDGGLLIIRTSWTRQARHVRWSPGTHSSIGD